MNPASLMSVAMAGATFVVGVLFLALSRARGWEMLRWFAVASLFGCVFCVTDIFFSLPGASEGVIPWAGRLGGAMAALHVASWIPFVRQRAGQPLGRLDRLAIGAAALLAVLYMVPGLVYTSEIILHEVPWWGVTYRIPQTTALAIPTYAVLVAILAKAMAALWRMSAVSGAQGGVLRAAIVIFLLTAANEALVAAHVVSTPFFLELGFTAVVVGVGIEITAKFLADARALSELSERLDWQVRERTTQLEAAQAELVRSERLASLGQLAAGVGHEINNPLSYVVLNLHALREGVADDKDLSQLSAEALDGAERIRRIVTDLRVLARTEVDEETMADLGAVLADAVKLVGPRLPKEVSLDVSTDGLPLVKGNPHRLAQVFANLVGNAAEAGAGRPVSIRATARLDGGGVRVEVIDTGPGIPTELLDRVFEPFFSTKRGGRRSGTGLGLAICRAIVESYGGDIEVRSDGRSGTTVEVRLRLAPRASTMPPPPPPSCDEPPPKARALRVLVIDDEPLVARAVGRALRGHAVTTALTGRGALALLVEEERAFDVVVCDLMLPDIGGAEVFREATRARPELEPRFFFLTGGAVDDEAEALLGGAGVRWLPKPVDPAVLQREVARVAEGCVVLSGRGTF